MDHGALDERLLSQKEISGEEEHDLKIKLRSELKALYRVAFPAIVSRVSQFGVIIVTQLFIGHVSDLDLAAFAVVQSIFLRFVNGILIGMSSATETLCGQAFGAKQYHMMGIYLQRSWIVDGATATLLVPFFIFTTPILKALGQDEDISIQAQKFALWFIPFLYYYVFGLTIQMYLQAQIKNAIVAWLALASFVLHVALSWLFVVQLGLGVHGAMAALNISNWTVVIGEFVYIFGGWCPETWKGFNRVALSDIFPIVKLSVSSGVMVCLELWYNAVLILVAGYMDNATIAVSAFSICLNINVWELMIGLGFMVASCVRVANELGRGNAKAAQFSIKVALVVNLCFGGFFFVICLAFGREISYFFTDNEEVAKTVSSLSVFLSFSILLNSFQTVLVGAVVGAGLQGIAAIVNLGSYYLIGVPLGVVLAFVAHLHVNGLWIGLLSGVVVQTVAFSFIVFKTDWDQQVRKTSERLNRYFVKADDGDPNSRERLSPA